MRAREDEFLWWQRRGIIALCLGVFVYGLLEKPILLVMTPLLVFAGLVACSGIWRDQHRP
jgi:hypothetical protein